MGSQTWGTGTDIFAVDYLDAQVPNSGNSQWKTSDAKNHMLSAVELRNLNGYYEAGTDTSTSNITENNTPFNRGTEGASSGYYRTLYYTSKTKGDYFFTQNCLMYDRHIITNVSDIQRLIWKPTVSKSSQSITLVDGTTKTVTIFSVTSFENNKVDILSKNNPETTIATNVNLVPALISPTVENALQTFPYWNRDSETITWVDRNVYRYSQTFGTGNNNVARYTPFISDDKIIFPNSASEISRYKEDKSGKYVLKVTYRAGDEYSYMTNMYANARYYITNEEEFLNILARSGLKFEYENTLYKPVVNNGVIVGYTDDMTKTSEWDNWHDYNDHEVPVTPPTPTPEDAEEETFGWGGNEVGGMARYYLLTSAEMESLADFMSDPLWTIDYRNCIISMFVVPNNGGLFDAAEPTTIKFKLDDNQKVDTGVSALRISGVNVNSSATIEIPRMNDNFLDFEPYSKYLLYVPFCGVIQLPDYVAGKEINVKIYPDVPTCSCTAIVTSEGRKIATVRGNIGSSIPITSDGSGIKTAAIINSMANGIVGVGEALMGGSTGNAGMVAGGVAQALGSVISTTLILGQAFGYSVGSSGDTSFFGVGTRCEYYIAYPKWNNPDTEETNIYGHTFGFVVNKRGKLKDFEGFTVCDNPHVYGFSCTAAEKEEIEMLLRQGIIIHISE